MDPRFLTPETHPLTLNRLLDSRLGKDWDDWEPETIWNEIELTFGVDPSRAIKDKILALETIRDVSSIAQQDWIAFEKVACALSGYIAAFGMIQKANPSQIAFALSIMRTVLGGEPELSNQVRGYISAVLHDEGFFYAPHDLFGDAQDNLARRNMFPSETPLREVAELWTALKDDPSYLDRIEEIQEQRIAVQLQRLAVVKEYLRAKERELIEVKP